MSQSLLGSVPWARLIPGSVVTQLIGWRTNLFIWHRVHTHLGSYLLKPKAEFWFACSPELHKQTFNISLLLVPPDVVTFTFSTLISNSNRALKIWYSHIVKYSHYHIWLIAAFFLAVWQRWVNMDRIIGLNRTDGYIQTRQLIELIVESVSIRIKAEDQTLLSSVCAFNYWAPWEWNTVEIYV